MSTYENIGDEVSVEGSIVQAAQALDFAGRYATEGRDTERLLQVAEAWQKVADFIVDFSEHEAKMRERIRKSAPFGFGPAEPPDESDGDDNEIEEENAGSTSDGFEGDDGADESPSGPGVDEEHGQLRIPESRCSNRRLRTQW